MALGRPAEVIGIASPLPRALAPALLHATKPPGKRSVRTLIGFKARSPQAVHA